MLKFFGGVVVGVFVGALAVEIIERTSPAILDKVRDRARDLGTRIRGGSVYVDNVLHRQEAVRDGAHY